MIAAAIDRMTQRVEAAIGESAATVERALKAHSLHIDGWQKTTNQLLRDVAGSLQLMREVVGVNTEDSDVGEIPAEEVEGAARWNVVYGTRRGRTPPGMEVAVHRREVAVAQMIANDEAGAGPSGSRPTVTCTMWFHSCLFPFLPFSYISSFPFSFLAFVAFTNH